MPPLNPFQQYAHAIRKLAVDARDHPLATFRCEPCPSPEPNAPRILMFSPHPDDEVVIGGLALRLMRESGWRVINVAVTLGSKPERQLERLAELKRCCDCIGFELLTTGPRCLDRIRPATRNEDPNHWQTAVEVIARILRDQKPEAVLFPHAQDWNSTHEGVHLLVSDALAAQSSDFSCLTVETEFWGAMDTPNLMVEITAGQLGDLITALSYHVGEVRRNPYHLTLPAWMIDNVRRGAELVGGQGEASPDFAYATLYRARRWTATGWEPLWSGGRHLPASAPASVCLTSP